MTQYNVEVMINEHLFVEADTQEEAIMIAEQQATEGFDVEPYQVSVHNVKEIK